MRSVPAILRRSVVLVVLLVLTPSAEAAKRDPVPRLANLVTLELTLLDGETVTVTVPDGRLATFANHDLGYRVGIVPNVVDAASGEVELELFEVADRSGRPAVKGRLEVLRGQVGFRSVTAAAGALPLDIRVLEAGPLVRRPGSACTSSSDTLSLSPVPDEGDEMRNWADGCCVTCGGLQTCGCSVATSCGTCWDCC
jgi:hypothetical protein